MSNIPLELDKTVEVDDTVKSRHNIAKTEATVKEILKDGTPDWVRFPKDYKQMALEDQAYHKEKSDGLAAKYKIQDQDILTDEASRLVNFMPAAKFLGKLRDVGIISKIYDGGKRGTLGLYCIVPGKERADFQFICSIQWPVMPEWSVISEDEHGLSQGESAIGWRSVLYGLIKSHVLTEEKAHKIFGKPVNRPFTARYRRSLYELRSGLRGDDNV